MALLGLVGWVVLAWLGLVASPEDVTQGDSVRIMYVHVPSAIVAFGLFALTAVGSVAYLWKRSAWWDRLAAASAEVGVLFCGLTLVTGMLWGKPTWGVWWTWDARLTTTALLFLLYLGYLAVRSMPGTVEKRSRRSAVVGVVAFADVPVVHFSVDWWRSLHQPATITRLDPTIDGLMLFTLVTGIITFVVTAAWLVTHRFRVEHLALEAEAAEISRELESRKRAVLGEVGGQ
ncbi:MAG: heme exporter protein C [Acidimicrobiales bacterium]|nr:MAG: heme exporter protein C [Acidimicrobiales bacterium]